MLTLEQTKTYRSKKRHTSAQQQAKMIHRLKKRIRFFLKSEDGPTSVEYAVVIMLILMAAIGGIQVFGSGLASSFAATDQKIGSAIGP